MRERQGVCPRLPLALPDASTKKGVCTMKEDKDFIKAAKEEWEDGGELQFDDDPKVSREKDSSGAYVQCWVWVDLSYA